MTDKTQLERMHEQIETIYTGCAHVECDLLHRYIDVQEGNLQTARANEGAWEATAQGHYEECAKQRDAYQQHMDEIIVALGSKGILPSGIVEAVERLVREKGEMQLVAGRYQFQFEHAMKCINSIDDLFEYAHKAYGGGSDLQAEVRKHIAKFTDAVKPKGK